jgi:hypothetical protein
MKHLGIAAALFLATACNVGDVDPPDDNNNPGGPDAGSVADVVVQGTIATDVVWTGSVKMMDETIISPGVNVTIAAGTVFEGAQGAVLRVEGNLEIAGTATEPVTMNPIAGAEAWGGIAVESGAKAVISHATGQGVATLMWCKSGALECSIDNATFSMLGKALDVAATATVSKSDFRDMANGGVSLKAGGDLTIVDSYIWTSTHDLVVTSGGKLTIDYSEIGGANMSYEHCDLHIGAADSVKITNSNIVSAIYGVMIGNTNGAVFNNNNFIDNTPNQDISPVGPNTSADLTGNYWSNGAPDLGTDYDTSNPVTTQIQGIGPRM